MRTANGGDKNQARQFLGSLEPKFEKLKKRAPTTSSEDSRELEPSLLEGFSYSSTL